MTLAYFMIRWLWEDCATKVYVMLGSIVKYSGLYLCLSTKSLCGAGG